MPYIKTATYWILIPPCGRFLHVQSSLSKITLIPTFINKYSYSKSSGLRLFTFSNTSSSDSEL